MKTMQIRRGALVALAVIQAAGAVVIASCGGSGSGNANAAAVKTPGVAQSSAALARSADDTLLVAVNSEADRSPSSATTPGTSPGCPRSPSATTRRRRALEPHQRAFVACSDSGTLDVVQLSAATVIRSIAVGRDRAPSSSRRTSRACTSRTRSRTA
jgi:hypothetical protein